MTESLSTALQLLVIGMISVFFILSLVVFLAKVLIYFVNKYPVELDQEFEFDKGSISKHNLAVLNSAIETITKGKGVIKSVKKI